MTAVSRIVGLALIASISAAPVVADNRVKNGQGQNEVLSTQTSLPAGGLGGAGAILATIVVVGIIAAAGSSGGTNGTNGTN